MAGPRPPRSPHTRGFRPLGKQARQDISSAPNTRGISLPKLPNTGNYTFTKGPNIFRAQARTEPWLPVPGYWGQRSELEYVVFWVLTKVLKKYPIQAPDGYPGPWGEDFSYQAPFEGGRVQYGGIVVDFVMLDGSEIALNPLGFHWHQGYGTGQQARDIAAKADLLTRFNILLIFMDELPLRQNPIGIVKEALQGIDRTEYSHKG